jgi:RNA polymerase sigma-70 factor (ECF subfamily)
VAPQSPVITPRSSAEFVRTDADRDLLTAIAAGDRTAFVLLYNTFAANVYRIVHSIIRDPHQAEEVSQEVFLAIWHRSAHFDPGRGSLASYIAVLAHGKAVDRVRSSQAARTRDDNYSTKNIDRGELHDPVSETALLQEEHLRIREALAGLTRIQREAIELRYFKRHTYEEAGQLLGVSVVAMKARVRSGVQQLRQLMGADQ